MLATGRGHRQLAVAEPWKREPDAGCGALGVARRWRVWQVWVKLARGISDLLRSGGVCVAPIRPPARLSGQQPLGWFAIDPSSRAGQRDATAARGGIEERLRLVFRAF